MLIVLGSRGGDDTVVCRIVTDVLMVIESLCNFFFLPSVLDPVR